MRDIGGSDDHGEQVRSGRGVKSSNRPASPFWDLRLSPASRFHHRHSRPEQASPDRRRSRDHSRHSSTELVRRQPDAEELILRYRESTLRNTEPGNDRPSRHSRARDAPTSSPSTKRHRDLSHPPESAHRKRSEKPYSPSRHERGYSRDSDSRKRRRLSPHEPSHRRPPHSHRSPRRSEDTRPQHKRSYSRSPTRNDLIRRHTASRASKYGPPPPLSQSPSPGPERLREHNRRQRAPSARSSRPSQSYGAASQDYPGADPDRRPLHRQAPPRSPQPYRDQRRRDQSPNAHFTSHPDLDDDMTSRSSYRAGNKALYAHKPYYGNEPRSSDAQGYSQSPQRGGGSYQNSPSMSPYGAYRAGLTGQYSPQQYVLMRRRRQAPTLTDRCRQYPPPVPPWPWKPWRVKRSARVLSFSLCTISPQLRAVWASAALFEGRLPRALSGQQPSGRLVFGPGRVPWVWSANLAVAPHKASLLLAQGPRPSARPCQQISERRRCVRRRQEAGRRSKRSRRAESWRFIQGLGRGRFSTGAAPRGCCPLFCPADSPRLGPVTAWLVRKVQLLLQGIVETDAHCPQARNFAKVQRHTTEKGFGA